MTLTLFNHESVSVSESRNRSSQYQHTYGGTVDGHGIRVRNVRTPFHLLFDLDLRDPAIDVRIPGISRLPLLYGFNYSGTTTDQQYFVRPDKTIDVFGIDSSSPDFGVEIPASFPETPISFENTKYDPKNAEDALSQLQVFGLNHLPASELERAISIAYDKWPGLDVYEDWSVYRDLTKKEYLELWGSPPFAQPGGVSRRCQNPLCGSITYQFARWIPVPFRGLAKHLLQRRALPALGHTYQEDSLRVFAMLNSAELVLIFSYCHLCHSIHVTNQAS